MSDPINDHDLDDLRDRFARRIAPGVGGAARDEERVAIPPPPTDGQPPPPADQTPPPPTPGIGFAFLLPQVWATVDDQRLQGLMTRLLTLLQDEQATPLESMIAGSMLQALGAANPGLQLPTNLLLYDLHLQVVNQVAYYLKAQASTPAPTN